jgi:protease-4
MSTDTPQSDASQPQIIVNVPPQASFLSSWFVRVLCSFLLLSVIVNFALISSQSSLTQLNSSSQEAFVSGDRDAKDRIAIIKLEGTIMPPFTGRILDMIESASEDDTIKGVLLSIDSPGGFVADSHQIYHRLKQLAEKKPIYVSMKRIAASGGVYAAMGIGETGKIFAEPTTWTGSIGVIIPRYDMTGLSEKFGVTSDSLTTGEFKDSLNPFRPLSDRDREVWGAIIDDSFDRFVAIVAEGRAGLDEATVREKLATGQIFTANQAVENGLIDAIAFEDEVIETMQTDLNIESMGVITYRYTPTPLEILMGNIEARDPEVMWRKTLEATVPRALYYCSWLPVL